MAKKNEKSQRYFQMTVDEQSKEACIDIYGDIMEYPWECFGEYSAAVLSRQLQEMPEGIERITVNINSYGGSVKEGLAIYNALRRHGAKVRTVCDGMACSIASVIFMAGDERVMSESSLLMVHNAWTTCCGNAEELRKQADDIDTINDASVKAYLSRVGISEEELRELMDSESWICAGDALDMGFATEVVDYEDAAYSQSVRKTIAQMLTAKQDAEPDDGGEGEEPEPEPQPEPGEEPEKDDEEDEGEEPDAKQKYCDFINAIMHNN